MEIHALECQKRLSTYFIYGSISCLCCVEILCIGSHCGQTCPQNCVLKMYNTLIYAYNSDLHKYRVLSFACLIPNFLGKILHNEEQQTVIKNYLGFTDSRLQAKQSLSFQTVSSRSLFLKSSGGRTQLISCKLGKEMRREWGEAGKQH